MIKTIYNRFEQGYRTNSYPKKTLTLPRFYRGRPTVNQQCSPEVIAKCVEACPQNALDKDKKRIDLGKCVFCGRCEKISKGEFIKFSNHFEMGVASREALLTDGNLPDLAKHAKKHFKSLFGRSLQLREVSAAGCNACEADTNVLATPFFDLARFGIQFVASPRHADGIFVTGPVSVNMKTALLTTWEAIPSPKVVIACGSCALTGGPFYGSPEIVEWGDKLIPVDLYIPGCPPHPMTILSSLLGFFK